MELNSYIDHTLLKPDATYAQIEAIAKEAIAHRFASVCANPIHVKRLAALLAGTGVRVCTVIGFPLGANAPEVKAFEAEAAVRDGAQELDMVINVGALKSGRPGPREARYRRRGARWGWPRRQGHHRNRPFDR